MATARRSLAGPSLPETINPFTQERIPAYLIPGANPLSGNFNAGIEEAQHNFAGAGPAALTAALRRQGLSFGALGSSGSASRPGGRVSLAAPRMDGGDDAARSGMLNAYLSELADENAQRPANAPLDAVEAELREMRARSEVKRAAAIANTPDVSARGREILPKNAEGRYETADPTGEPVNRQAIAAQMAPGLIAPPAATAPKPVTFDAPMKAIVNGKQVFVRPGSDGQTYDMARRPIDPAALQPIPDKATGPLETIVGPDGKPIRVRQEDAIGKEPAAGTMKASTGQQKRVLNFFNRAQQADGELEGLEEAIQGMGLAEQGRLKFAPNFAQSQLGQSYGAAQRAFTEARLRKDSGAAIPEQEFKSDRETYFAQPGDSKETLEQKRRARGAMLASLAFESGQALGEFVGDEAEAKSVVQRYKDRAAGKAATGGGTVEMVAPDGRVLDVPAADVAKLTAAGAKRKGG